MAAHAEFGAGCEKAGLVHSSPPDRSILRSRDCKYAHSVSRFVVNRCDKGLQ